MSETLTEMLPGTEILTFSQLTELPEHSVVLRRSEVQPYFRTAWTLGIINGRRYWSSSSWRYEPDDLEILAGAMEPPILLYRPVEQFGIGTLREAGWLDLRVPVTVHENLAAAQEALASAGDGAVLTHRIDPGPWQVHGRD